MPHRLTLLTTPSCACSCAVPPPAPPGPAAAAAASASSSYPGPQHEKFQSAPGSRVGTPAYLAPEVILTTKGKTYDGKVDLDARTPAAAHPQFLGAVDTTRRARQRDNARAGR